MIETALSSSPTKTSLPSIAVFIPIRNEASHVDGTVTPLLEGLRRGNIQHLVLVIDGPTDETPERLAALLGVPSEVLRGRRRTHFPCEGCLVLVHPEPLGKGRAFMEAMCTLKGRTSHFDDPANIVVNLDADVLSPPLDRVLALATELAAHDVPMIVGTVDEQRLHNRAVHDRAEPRASGFRALRASALDPLFAYDRSWVEVLPARFGLDYALNRLIYPEGGLPISSVSILHAPPHRHNGLRDQESDRFAVEERLAGTNLEENYVRLNQCAGYAFSERLAAFRRRDGASRPDHTRDSVTP